MPSFLEITVGARNSALSKAQFEEFAAELKQEHPEIILRPIYIETMGDLDKITSLRTLDKTDFFTREIDQMQLRGECRLSVHSAKDLPEPLTKGLVLAKLTKGIDPSDALVLREHERLPQDGLVATSSVRREENVRQLFPHVHFTDIRGTIEERLAKLTNHEVDGVVIAEAALIRLKLTHLNRIRLPGKTTPLQGKLAILARADDQEILSLLQFTS
jgi:hydroxymethylbilane synthase